MFSLSKFEGSSLRRIRLGTGVCLIPKRNPILTAKQVATLDDSSGGRFLLGIGAGWNPEESTILGGDFEHRWSQVKDYVVAMKVLWTEDISEYHGRYVNFPPVRCFPKPKSKPHPPILLGSINNPRALRRVAEWGDGWLPVIRSVDEFADGVQRIKVIAVEIGRDPNALDFTAFGAEKQWRSAQEIRDFERAGANRVVLWLIGQDVDSMFPSSCNCCPRSESRSLTRETGLRSQAHEPASGARKADNAVTPYSRDLGPRRRKRGIAQEQRTPATCRQSRGERRLDRIIA
jgi:probable F420-dependent oxidoreductase